MAGEGLHNPEPASSVPSGHHSPTSLDLSIRRCPKLASALGLGIRFPSCLESQLLSDFPCWILLGILSQLKCHPRSDAPASEGSPHSLYAVLFPAKHRSIPNSSCSIMFLLISQLPRWMGCEFCGIPDTKPSAWHTWEPRTAATTALWSAYKMRYIMSITARREQLVVHWLGL